MRLTLLVFFSLLLNGCGGGGDKETTTPQPTNNAPTLQLSSNVSSAIAGEEVSITATASDVDGSISRYQWQQTSGSTIALPADLTNKFTFIVPTIDADETLSFDVTVSDNDGAMTKKSISVQVNIPNAAPVVAVSSFKQQAATGEEVIINSTVDDEDLNSITYLWRQTSGVNIALAETTQSTLTFMVPAITSPSQITFQLQVTDNKQQSSTAQITIDLVIKGTVPPEVYPISTQANIMANEQKTLSVSAIDDDGEIVSYKWEQMSGPTVTFEDKGTATLDINVPDLSINDKAEFKITVIDNDGLSANTTLSVNLFPRFEMKTIKGRTDGKGVDLVILGDGFTKDQLPLLAEAATNFMQAFTQEETIKIHQQAWNIHRIDSYSKESGADFPNDNNLVDTVFDSYFQCANIARLLCVDTAKVLAVTAKLAPQFDQVIVVVNSQTYGGAGGQVATYSLASSATDIAIHELGHSFAGLADEYTYGATDNNIYEPSEPNVTTITELSQVKWRHWFADPNNVPTQSGESGVGLFEGARYHEKNYYRSLDNSIMRNLGRPFGPVNAEAWAISVFSTAGSTTSIEPNNEFVSHTAGSPLTFSITPIQDQSINKTRWWVNDVLQNSDNNEPNKLTITEPIGTNYRVKVALTDQSGLIRKDDRNIATFTHTWSVTAQ